jgi:cytochrome c-type biogenesis protein CcmH/NrfG
LENNGNGQEFEEEELDEPVAPQRANYSTRPLQRPEIAFALAGGGSGGSTPGIGGSGGNFTPRRASKINGFSLPWLVLLGGAALIMIVGWVLPVTMECKYTSVFCQTSGPGLTHTGNRWASFSTMFFMAVGFLFLIFGRAYDPDPAQSAEARNPAGLFVKLMVLAAFCIIAGLEVIYLADDFANSYRERANSIFKFYYQAWTMLALASAFIAYVLWTNWIAPRWSDAQRQGGLFRNALRFGWIGIASLLAISCSLYAFLVTPARISERMSTPLPAPTLDGRAYFDTLRRVTGMPNMPLGKSFDMFYEAKSMREFYDNIKGTPVVLQSSIWPYRGGGSWIAVNTGLPIVLGYDHHSSQQHYDFQVWKRSNNGGGGGDIHEMYDTADIENAISLINRYHITYIHLGVIEREADVFRPCNPGEPGDTSRSRTPLCYEPMVSESGFAKFDKMVSLGLLEIAYQNPGVTVLKVTARGRSGVIDPVAAAQNPTTVISTDPKLARLLDQVKREPDNFQARYDLGTYYFKRGEMAKAAEQFEAVVKLVPNEVNPWHVLGDIYAALGDNQKALAAWKEPTVRAPNIPAGHNKYALGLVAVGRLEEAINEFNLTIKLNPKYVEASYHLGDLYEKQGKKPEAITAYTYVIQNSSAPTDFWASRASERLRALGRT